MALEVDGKFGYFYNRNEDQIYLKILRDGKIEWVPVNFRPRFYIEEKFAREVAGREEVKAVIPADYLTMDTGEPVVEVQVRQPKDVVALREYLKGKGIKTYEADLPYVKVLLMNDVVKVNYSEENVAFFDIELWDKDGFPKEYGGTKFMCVGAITNDKYFWVHRDDFDDELDMLIEFIDWLMENGVSIVVGWNVQFDYQHILGRLEKLRAPKKYIEYWRMLYPLDLMEEYKNAVKGLSSYSLEEVSKYEGWEPKHRDKMIWQMTYDELFEYNMYDVELLKKLEDRYGFANVKLTLANLLNLNVEHLSPTQIWDIIILKRLHKLGFVAWTAPRPSEVGIREEDLDYEGALVKEPEIGLWENVLYADFTSLYPSIVINENVEIEGFNGEVVPYLMKKYFDLRQKYKKLAKEYKAKGDLAKAKYYDLLQKAIKVIINGGYGAFAWINLKDDAMFRFFKLENASFITAKGREIARKTWEFVESVFGVKVLYIDTDGLQIWLGPKEQFKGWDEVLEFANEVVQSINDYIAPYNIKVEAVMRKVMYFGDYDKDERRWVGIKKKYVALKENGEYLYRGLELRRGDASPFQKKVLQEVIDMVFKNNATVEDIMAYMKRIKKELYKGKFDEDLIIVKTMSKGEDEYKSIPPHIKAYKKAVRFGKGFEDGRVKYVWSKGFPEPVWDGRDIKKIPIDYDRYWDYVMNSVRKIVVALTIQYLRMDYENVPQTIKKVWKFFGIYVPEEKKNKKLTEFMGNNL